jgi:hypothetical protein
MSNYNSWLAFFFLKKEEEKTRYSHLPTRCNSDVEDHTPIKLARRGNPSEWDRPTSGKALEQR